MAEPAAGALRDLARIRALGEHAALRAGLALGGLLGFPVEVRLGEIRCLSASALAAMAHAPVDEVVAGLQTEIHGESDGWALLLLPLPTVSRVLQALMGAAADNRDLTAVECSAIQEVGNIAVSSFLSELGERLGRRLLPSAPAMQLDSAARLAQGVLASARSLASEAVVVQALVEDRERQLQGRLFIVSKVAAWQPARRVASGERGDFA